MNNLERLESRLTLRVKQARLSNDDLSAILKRILSSRSIQWWKDDIKQLLYEVKCLKDENAVLQAEVTRWQSRARLYHNTIVELQRDREAEREAIEQ